MPFDPSSDDAWSNPGPLRITVHARSPDYPFPGAPLVPGGAYDDWSSWLAPPGDGSSSADWPGFGDAPSFLNGPVSWPLLPATIPNPANIGFAFSSAPTDPSNNYQNLATAPFGAPSAQPTPRDWPRRAASAKFSAIVMFGAVPLNGF